MGLTAGDQHYERTGILLMVGDVCAAAETLAAPPADEPLPECTGFAAGWCPIHGTCTCPGRAEIEGAVYQPDCPLHGERSEHAEAVSPADEPLWVAAQALVDKLDAMCASPQWLGLFGLAHSHGIKYDGPTFGPERDALRAALARKEG
jgi:hypothetical protein